MNSTVTDSYAGTAIAEQTRPGSALTRVAGIFIPERSPSERYIALSIFVASFLYLCLFRRYSWIDPDEGIILQGAERIINGQILYRDFFSFFTPGSYYLLALVFRIFGDSLLVAHTALAFVGAAFSPVTYLLSRRVCSRQSSLLVTALMTITALPLRFVVLHNWDSTLLACLGIYCAVRLLERPNRSWAFAAASFVSLTGMFEQSKGAGLLLGISTGFLIIVYRGHQPRIFSTGRLVAIALGLAWPLLMTAAYFASRHALLPMLQSWLWPLQHYATANRVPYGYENLTVNARVAIFGPDRWSVRLLKILVFSPLLWLPVLPLFGVALFFRLALPLGKTKVIEWRHYLLISASISGLLLSVLVVRQDYEHFVFLHPVFLLLLAWLIDGRNVRSGGFVRCAPVLGLCLAMPLLLLGAALLFRTRAEHAVVTRKGTLTTPIGDEVAEYVQARVSPGEHILIYPYEPTYYYLTQSYSPTGYEYYQPGMHTQQQVQEMLSGLAAHQVRVVLYDRSFAEHAMTSWPNTPLSALAYDPVADYITREYHTCRRIRSAVSWELEFMVRNDLQCP